MDWISVEERLPPMHEVYKDSPLASGEVLIFTGDWVSVGEYSESFRRRQGRWKNARGFVVSVTHWMPLPKKPGKREHPSP